MTVSRFRQAKSQSMSNHNLDMSKIEKLLLAPTLNKTGYADLFYDHLTAMFKFRMMSASNNRKPLNLNEKAYLGLEQYVLESTEVVEKQKPNDDIDWDRIDVCKDMLTTKIRKMLGDEAKCEIVKPIIDFTVNTYENSLIYQNLHAESLYNPWIPTDEILFQKGYLFLVSDKKDLVENYKKKIEQPVDKGATELSPLFIIATNQKAKTFSGFQIDTRNKIQGIVYDYLKREAKTLSSAKQSTQIKNFLESQGFSYGNQYLKATALLPLKRTGLIGSTTAGYFCIDKETDLRASYLHHKNKISGIQKTLEMHELKARAMNFSL